jgi:hypothetical protein
MKWVNVYLVGYVIFIIGVVAALAKSGVIQRVGTGWTVIGVVIAIGIGIMMSISASGRKETIDIDRH